MGHPNPKSTQLSSHTAGFKCSLHVARVIPCAGNGFNIRQPIKESGSTSWLILFRHVQAVLCNFLMIDVDPTAFSRAKFCSKLCQTIQWVGSKWSKNHPWNQSGFVQMLGTSMVTLWL